MKLLFIDCRSLQCSGSGACAGAQYEAERGPDEALLRPRSHAHCSEGGEFTLIRKLNAAFYEAWRGSSPPPLSAYDSSFV